jgi:hypothetical protein
MTYANQNIDSNYIAAYQSGLDITNGINPDNAFSEYRAAVKRGEFKPARGASVCFVAGYLGRDFPEHDSRIYS